MEIPLIGFGTWELRGRKCQKAVEIALDIGYQHLDTAFYYENHRDIAKGIGNFSREKLFLTTKYATDQVDVSNIDKSIEALCDRALTELHTDYLDLFLIHAPDRQLPLEAFLATMHKLVEKEKIRFPGVSNYTIHHLQDAYDVHLTVPFNQVELHPYLTQPDLVTFCREHGTQVVAYRPFGKGQLFNDEPLFAQIGKNHGKTASQVILRWFIQKEIPVIPKATSEAHIRENFDVFDFALNPDEMEKIDQLNRNHRYTVDDWTEFDY